MHYVQSLFLNLLFHFWTNEKLWNRMNLFYYSNLFSLLILILFTLIKGSDSTKVSFKFITNQCTSIFFQIILYSFLLYFLSFQNSNFNRINVFLYKTRENLIHKLFCWLDHIQRITNPFNNVVVVVGTYEWIYRSIL